jgi:5-methylthioribose kinase
MAYQQLNLQTLVDFLKTLDEMKSIFSDFNHLEVKEVGDGNLNFVYMITNTQNTEETVVLKQAVPYVRLVGESWPLPRERMNFEIMALEKENELCPKHVPNVYYASKEMSLVVMQNLNKHRVLRGEIIQGKYFPLLADHVSTFLAKTLFYTSDWYLDYRSKKEMVGKFINIDLCNITEDLVFTDPYEKNETNSYNPKLTKEDINFIQEDRDLKIAVAQMKYKFMNNAEALVHGDLHIGSLMVNEEETYMIDPEFAFYGPMGFDIGAVIGNLFMSYFSHSYRQKLLGRKPYAYRKWLLDTTEKIWNEFARKFDICWTEHQEASNNLYWDYPEGKEHFAHLREVTLKRIFSDTIGFGACKMMRRIFGLAKVADIADIQDLDERAKIERMVLHMAKEIVIHREEYSSIEELVDLAKEISPLV